MTCRGAWPGGGGRPTPALVRWGPRRLGWHRFEGVVLTRQRRRAAAELAHQAPAGPSCRCAARFTAVQNHLAESRECVVPASDSPGFSARTPAIHPPTRRGAMFSTNDKLLDQIFNLKFTAKQLARASRKCESEEKSEKLKIKKAIEKGARPRSWAPSPTARGYMAARRRSPTPPLPQPPAALMAAPARPPAPPAARRQPGGRQDICTECNPEKERGAQLPQACVAPRRGRQPTGHAGQDAGARPRPPPPGCRVASGLPCCRPPCSHLVLPFKRREPRCRVPPSAGRQTAHPPPPARPPGHQQQVINKSMAGIVKSLDSALRANNLEAVARTMDQFERQFENLDVQSEFVEQAMNNQAVLSTPEDDVNLLMQVRWGDCWALASGRWVGGRGEALEGGQCEAWQPAGLQVEGIWESPRAGSTECCLYPRAWLWVRLLPGPRVRRPGACAAGRHARPLRPPPARSKWRTNTVWRCLWGCRRRAPRSRRRRRRSRPRATSLSG
jgi:hypothetical protein